MRLKLRLVMNLVVKPTAKRQACIINMYRTDCSNLISPLPWLFDFPHVRPLKFGFSKKTDESLMMHIPSKRLPFP